MQYLDRIPSHDECLQAMRAYVRGGGLIRALPAQDTPARVSVGAEAVYESISDLAIPEYWAALLVERALELDAALYDDAPVTLTATDALALDMAHLGM